MSAQSSSNTQGATNSTSASNGTTNPWSAQVPYLNQAFQTAGNALGNSGQYTPDQLGLYSSMLGAYQNPLLQGASTSSANAGSTASGAGASGVTTGVNNLSNFNPASTNNTAANIAGGNAMVAGSNIPGQVAAGMTSAEQAAAFGASPTIDRNAAASGNINSSRDAIEHGVLSGQLAQDATQMGTQLGANAFNTGVNATSNSNIANNNVYAGSMTSLLNGGAGAVNSGTSANTGAVNNAGGLYNIASSGASGQNTDPYQSALAAMGIFGGTGYGSSTTGNVATNGTSNSTQTWDPSQMSQLGAWLNMAGSLV